MTVSEKLLDAGYEDVIIFENYSYDEAFLGVTEDNRAVYSYDKMIECLINEEGFEEIDAIEWIEYNTLRALPYMGDKAPVIIYEIN